MPLDRLISVYYSLAIARERRSNKPITPADDVELETVEEMNNQLPTLENERCLSIAR